jgi:serine protease Do
MRDPLLNPRAIALLVFLGAASGVIASALTVGYLFTYVTELDALMAPFRLSAERPRAVPRTTEEEIARVRSVALPSAVAVLPSAPAGRVREVSEARAFGVVLTSDGWLLLGSLDGRAPFPADAVIGRKVYPIRRVEPARVDGLYFARVEAANLSVAPFGRGGNLASGDRITALLGPDAMRFGFVEAVRMAPGGESSEEPARRIFSRLSSPGPVHGTPLVNAGGELVGITVSGEGEMLSAIAFETLLPSLRSLLKNDEISRPTLGVRGYHAAFLLGGEERIQGFTNGFWVTGRGAIAAGSAARRAGIEEGDVILSVNGEMIQRDRTLDEALAAYTGGDQVRLEIDRDGIRLPLSVVLGAAP